MRRSVIALGVLLLLCDAALADGHTAKDSTAVTDVIGEIKTDRWIKEEGVVNGPVAEVYKAWTTSEGITSWLAGGAIIELKIGGLYEVHFGPELPEGMKGTEGCHVLSFLPNEMLSMEWNAPPAVPVLRDAGMRNWVVVQFADAGDSQTKVTLTHMGWGEGEHWDKTFEYFTGAWPNVIKACQDYFGGKG